MRFLFRFPFLVTLEAIPDAVSGKLAEEVSKEMLNLAENTVRNAILLSKITLTDEGKQQAGSVEQWSLGRVEVSGVGMGPDGGYHGKRDFSAVGVTHILG